MKSIVLCVFVLFAVFDTSVNGLHLPSYIKVCNVREAGFKECAIKNGNEAIPYLVKGDRQYNVPSFLPLVLPFVRLGAIGMDLNATNVKISGFENGKLVDVGVDLEKLSVFFRLSFPLLNLELDYNVAGKIVSLPIEGHGPGTIVMKNTIIQYTVHAKSIEKNGKRFLQFAKEDLEVNPEGGISFNFKNLFNGDMKLGDHVNNFLTENWKDVLVEVGPSLTEIVGTIIKSIVSTLLEKIPVEEYLPGF